MTYPYLVSQNRDTNRTIFVYAGVVNLGGERDLNAPIKPRDVKVSLTRSVLLVV
jgi:hypothetical protein